MVMCFIMLLDGEINMIMNVRNRMADVVKLRCNACQDFLALVIQPGWQSKLYVIAKDAVEKSHFADNYIAAYEKMRDVGVENYKIQDMDVTFITQVVRFCGEVVKVNKPTKDALIKLKDDRNLTNHSSENEDAEELYLRGLLALCNLQNFVRTIDKVETNIDSELRLEYRNKWLPQIEDLKNTLDEERILLIQRDKDIDRDINRIIESNEKLGTWVALSELYMNRYWKLENDYDRYNEFIVKSSDAGIVEAHNGAANYYFLIKKDYIEGEKRLLMILNSFDKVPAFEAKSIVDMINHYLMEGNELTDSMREIVDSIVKQGYLVVENENGFYQWKKNK